jgi:hypothetical protein
VAKYLSGSRRRPLSRGLLLLVLVLIVASGSISVYFLYPFGSPGVTRVKGDRVAIIDALSDFNPNPSFEEEARGYVTAAGMSVDTYNSSVVSIDFMKSFPAGYDLVIFRVHSATSRHGVFYFTSEPYDEAKHQPEQYRDEVRPGRDYEGHPEVFAFGPKFVSTYLQDRFQNAIIIGMGCFGAGTSYGTEEEVSIENVTIEKVPNLADAFYQQGALAVIGWDKLVSLSFSDQATLRLIKALAVDRQTTRQAVMITNRELGPDPSYKSVLVFYPEEGGDKVLHIPAAQYRNPSETLQLPAHLATLALRATIH